MRTRVRGVLVCLSAGTMSFAGDPTVGTWKLNEAKSNLAARTPKNSTVVYEATGDKVKVTVDGVDPEGKPTHSEWTGMFDGKDYRDRRSECRHAVLQENR